MDVPEPEVAEEGGEEHPRGTFFLVIVFLVMIVLLWFWTYGVLIERGA